MVKKNHEEFKKDFYNIYDKNEFYLTTEYAGSKEPIKIKHKCGFEWETIPNTILAKKRDCPRCSKRGKFRDTAYFKKEVFDLVGDEYEVLGEYVDNKTHIQMKHSCGYEYPVSPHMFLNRNRRCPKCSGLIKNKTTEYFKKEVFDLVGDEYEVLGEYTGNKNKIEMFHKKCGKNIMVVPNEFLNHGRRCKNVQCDPRSIDEEIFLEKAGDIFDEKFALLNEYEAASHKIHIKCNSCGEDFEIAPFIFTNNPVCKYCETTSQGERKIIEYLTKNNIPFEVQKYQLLNEDGNYGLFDFYIPDKDIFIEYDGEYHYKPIHGYDELQKAQERDLRKNSFCQKNNKKIIRIPYWDFDNIEKILNDEL